MYGTGRHRSRAARLGLRTTPILAVLCCLAGGAGTRADGAYPTAAETRAEFDGVCRRLTTGDYPFFGTAVVPELREQLAQIGSEPLANGRLRGRLAWELIRLGRHRESLDLLASAPAVIRSSADPELRELALNLLKMESIAHLLLAEDENCVGARSARSCILPIRPEAYHVRPSHSRRAGDLFLEILAVEPQNLQARWLLNLSRMLTGDFPDGVPARYRWPDAPAATATGPEWRDIAPILGVDAFDLSGGAAIDDFDGDGLLDIVSSTWDPCGPMKAYRNDGKGGFEDVADAWGLSSQLGGLNFTHADFDGDGRLDLFVLRGGWLGTTGRIRNSLLRNDLDGESGRFVDVTAAAGMAYPAYPTQTAAWADYDGDGDLDVFIGNEAETPGTNPLQISGREGGSYPSQLFRNNGDGTFTDVGRGAGVTNLRYAKGTAWGDYDDDGDPDLYISNIGPNRLYRNNGDGTFTDVAPELGVIEPDPPSFPTWFFDYDNDGDLDLFVATYRALVSQIAGAYLGNPFPEGRPLIYRNDGGRFAEVSRGLGLELPHLPMGANYGDFDNDGWLDFYLGTGIPDFDALMPNVMYRNDGGRQFVDATFSGGFGNLQKGHAVALGDLDNDGAQELYQQLGGAFPFDAYFNALYENPGSDHHWITLRLEGREANRFAVGARIEVRVRDGAGLRSIHRVAGTGGSFGSSSLQQEIGLGRADAVEAVIVEWPGSGRRQTFPGVPLDGFYRAVEGDEVLRPIALPRLRFPTSGAAAPHEHHGP